MKRCPECRKDYLDDSLLYCLDDGAALVQGSVGNGPATAILPGDRVSDEGLTRQLSTDEARRRTKSITFSLPAFLSGERLPWILLGVTLLGLAVAVGYAVRNGRAVATSEVVRTAFYIQPPQRRAGFGQIAVSPDGRNIVVASDVEGKTVLWLRPIDSLEGRALAGTDGVVGFPFWSPDSRTIGFWVAENKLKRIDIADGTVMDLGEAPAGAGGAGCAWNRDGTILCNGRGGITRLSASGGVSDRLPGYDSEQDELLRWQSFLPDGKHFLFLVTNSDRTKSEVFVGSIDGSTKKLLFAADSNAIYSASPDGKGGYLLFARAGALLAQAFDPQTLSVSGEPFRVAESVRVNTNNRGYFSVSDNGTLAYDPNTDEDEGRQLTWYDRAGKEIGTAGKAGPFFRFRLSPDEKLLSTSGRGNKSVNNDVLVTDISRGATSRLASFPGDLPETIWSPDGKYVVWNERHSGKARLMKKLASGAGESEVLIESNVNSVVPSDWSPDGKFILYTSFANRNRDIWVLPLEGDRTPFPYIQTPADDQSAVFSPDGKYVAYRSYESGSNQVYIQTFPASANKWPVSTSGGITPYWSRTGRELFYVQSGKLMSVEIKPGDPLSVGAPQPLVDFSSVRSPRNDDYAVSNDGQRLLFISRSADAVSPPIVAILNWSAGSNR
jgi:eukaryotic-like serine/threonine-protein kinase